MSVKHAMAECPLLSMVPVYCKCDMAKSLRAEQACNALQM